MLGESIAILIQIPGRRCMTVDVSLDCSNKFRSNHLILCFSSIPLIELIVWLNSRNWANEGVEYDEDLSPPPPMASLIATLWSELSSRYLLKG